jgi:hypothetical protein
VPKYPSYLPGGVLPNLKIELGNLSKQRIRDTFMAIESPEELHYLFFD